MTQSVGRPAGRPRLSVVLAPVVGGVTVVVLKWKGRSLEQIRALECVCFADWSNLVEVRFGRSEPFGVARLGDHRIARRAFGEPQRPPTAGPRLGGALITRAGRVVNLPQGEPSLRPNERLAKAAPFKQFVAGALDVLKQFGLPLNDWRRRRRRRSRQALVLMRTVRSSTT